MRTVPHIVIKLLLKKVMSCLPVSENETHLKATFSLDRLQLVNSPQEGSSKFCLASYLNCRDQNPI